MTDDELKKLARSVAGRLWQPWRDVITYDEAVEIAYAAIAERLTLWLSDDFEHADHLWTDLSWAWRHAMDKHLQSSGWRRRVVDGKRKWVRVEFAGHDANRAEAGKPQHAALGRDVLDDEGDAVSGMAQPRPRHRYHDWIPPNYQNFDGKNFSPWHEPTPKEWLKRHRRPRGYCSGPGYAAGTISGKYGNDSRDDWQELLKGVM